MKIGIVVDSFPNETFVQRQVGALDANVLCGVINTDKLKALKIRQSVFSYSDNKPIKPNIVDKILRGLLFRSSLGVRLNLNQQQSKNIKQLLKDEKISVILAQFIPNALRVIDVCEVLGVPLIVHCHGYDVTKLTRNNIYLNKLRTLFLRANAFIAVSNKMKADLVGFGCDPHKISVIPCGVPTDEFSVSGRQVDNTKCRFLFVGRFVEKKSPQNLLKAFRRCVDQDSQAELIMAGDGPLWESTKSAIEDLGLTNNVSLPGSCSSDEVLELMKHSDCYVQHSVVAPDGDEEGWPVSIAEAAACSLPIIATRHAGIVDQVIEGVSGFLVDEHDWRTMGDKMNYVIKNPKWRESAGAASREHIEKVGSFETSAQKIQKLAESILPTNLNM